MCGMYVGAEVRGLLGYPPPRGEGHPRPHRRCGHLSGVPGAAPDGGGEGDGGDADGLATGRPPEVRDPRPQGPRPAVPEGHNGIGSEVGLGQYSQILTLTFVGTFLIIYRRFLVASVKGNCQRQPAYLLPPPGKFFTLTTSRGRYKAERVWGSNFSVVSV